MRGTEDPFRLLASERSSEGAPGLGIVLPQPPRTPCHPIPLSPVSLSWVTSTSVSQRYFALSAMAVCTVADVLSPLSSPASVQMCA